ncbi:serine-threonine protein kinase [Streptomyces roseicoloratus]|uniref:Serine-threonine protein kinase n=1 Tax=Streptomyces roseicoloratus TaxID=2508722 RepID=A0ABY9S054_9ACTN|nr:serine-threonine protein kinase [Streptomyces roseicoloratus]WMX47811.1 serine-threonine protein kinase [Streptomyces roseicoloratus]
MTVTSVEPYREVDFDKDGDGPGGQAEALASLARRGCTDLVLFTHGWNNSRSVASGLFDRFFAPFPGVTGGGRRLGYAGLVWPSMMFSDERTPDYAALAAVAPGRTATVSRIAELLAEEPADEEAFAEFAGLLRELTGIAPAGQADPAGLVAAEVPAFLAADPLTVYAMFADAREAEAAGTGAEAGAHAATEGMAGAAAGPGVGGPGAESLFGGDRVKRLWKGAKEALRQATYFTMKRRAGVVGERGLGPLLGDLGRRAPGLRVHLVGHSFGARLVAHALRGLPADVRTVKSVTLLQGAFSHYAFADRLPHDRGRRGSLGGLQSRVDGPVVACHSRHDTALRVFYPLASRLARDDESLLGDDRRWWAIGYDGVQAVPGTTVRTLGAALRDGVPAAGCVSVDAAQVVSEHSDICHADLARLVARAGRLA